MSSITEKYTMKRWYVALLIGMVLLLVFGGLYFLRGKWPPDKNSAQRIGASAKAGKERFVYVAPLKVQGLEISVVEVQEAWLRKLQAILDPALIHWVSASNELPTGGLVLRPLLRSMPPRSSQIVYETSVEFLTWTGENEKILGTPLTHSVTAPSGFRPIEVAKQLLEATATSVAQELQGL